MKFTSDLQIHINLLVIIKMPEHKQQKSWLLHLTLINQAIDLMVTSQYKAAGLIIVKSLWIQHNHADAYFLLHLCQKQNDGKRLRMLQKAISMNPLCQIYDMQEDKALSKLSAMVKKSLDYEKKIMNEKQNLETGNWYNYTVYLHQQTDYQRVEEIYQRLFAKYPELYTKKSHAFLGNYANVLYDNGKYEQALQKYEKQIQLNPEQLRFFSNCSMLYTIVGNYQKAEEYIKEALRGNSGRSTFLFNYANILAKTQRYEQSIAKIKQAIQKESNDPIFRVKLAITLLLWKQNNSNSTLAAESLKKSIGILTESILKNNTQLTNCNKRILSMKNIVCVRIFAEKLFQLMKYQIKWDRMREFLEIFSDYLIVGQATKLQLNQKVRTMINQTLQSLKQNGENGEKLVEEFENISMIGELKNETQQQKEAIFRKFFKSWHLQMNRVYFKPSLQRE